MELAIPLLALGSLYIVSNQKKQGPQPANAEGFSSLPNTDVPDKNYDTLDIISEETDLSAKLSTVNKYDGTSAYTDKYFNPYAKNSLVKQSLSSTDTYKSINGEDVDAAYFQHNNMMPFFGGKIRSKIDPNSNESIMDNYLGSASQAIIKSEQAPLFAPNANYQMANGAPNMNDFYQSRVNPSMRMANVKPFEEVKVGPGLGLGYGTEGAGGYNSGNMMRESWLPKNVDDLRTANKQKASEMMQLGHEGPAKSRITNVGILGAFQKNRPETAFEWGQDRLFTTTGVGKGETLHSIPVERHVVRPETTVDYGGVAQSLHAQQSMPGEILPSNRVERGPTQLGAANAVGRGFSSDADYGIKSNQMYANNRSSNTQDNYFGAIGSSIGAVVAPLLEIMRPSRKENTTGNLRVYGDAKPAVSQSYLYNPKDAPAHTMRETTENSVNHWNVNRGQSNNAYLSTEQQAVTQERDTTHVSHVGGAGFKNSNARNYDAELSYQPSTLKAETIKSRFGNSNTNVFNNSVNYQGKPKDNDLVNSRESIPKMPYSTHGAASFGQYQQRGQTLDSNINMERNTPDLYSVLQQNPYAIKQTFKA
jgi:hypothetical protein